MRLIRRLLSYKTRPFFKNVEPIIVKTSRIDNEHVLITTTRGNDSREVVAVVFTDHELASIDKAKSNLSNNLSKSSNFVLTNK